MLFFDAILALYSSQPSGRAGASTLNKNGGSCFTRSPSRRKARRPPLPSLHLPTPDPGRTPPPGPGCGSAPGCGGEAGVDRLHWAWSTRYAGGGGGWRAGWGLSGRGLVAEGWAGALAFALWIPCLGGGTESQREARHGALNQGGLAGHRLEPERGSGWPGREGTPFLVW